ncbi:MAG: SOS response-associated peptidase [Verrucomicrobiota bacterium]
MCARYTLTREIAEVVRLIVCVNLLRAYAPRYNIAPHQHAPVVVREGHATELRLLRWGLVPAWAKDEKPGSKLINARMETVMEQASFRNAWRSRRCLIPADGFYEWMSTSSGKLPHYFTLKDGQAFCFAGLWERWQPSAASQQELFATTQEASPLETFTILTTGANTLVATLHDRMPVILKPEDYELWLDPASRVQKLAAILCPYDPDKMSCTRVSKHVNSSRVEGP